MKNIVKKILKNEPSTYSIVDSLLKKHKKAKLNIGCGTDYKRGWINIDNNSDNNIAEGRVDLDWDLRNPLPFPENSVDFIFHEHFLEHLTVEESHSAITDMMRVLKPGGVMRIAMPDLEDIFELYNDENWKNRPVIKNHGLDFVKTRAEMVNMSFSWWGHKWIYDWEELQRRFKELGYTKIKRCKNGKSRFKELQSLETREGSLLIAEVTK